MSERDVSDLLDVVDGDGPSDEFVRALRDRLERELGSHSTNGPAGRFDQRSTDVEIGSKEDPMEKRWWWGAGAVAAVVAVVVGAAVVAARDDEPAASDGADVPATAPPITAPETLPPLETSPPTSLPTLRDQPLAAGRYYVPISQWRWSTTESSEEWGATIEVPDLGDEVPEEQGWHGYGDWALNLDGDRNYVFIAFVIVDELYADPCQPNEGFREPPLGPTAEELAQALAADPSAVSPVVPTTVDGHPAYTVEIQAPDDLSECQDEEYSLFLATPHTGGRMTVSAREQHTVVDVDGKRVLIVVGSHPDAPPANYEQAKQVAETIRFVVPESDDAPTP